MPEDSAPEYWLEIHDSEISSAELAAEVERRVLKRRAEQGVIQPVFPTFGFISDYPEPPVGQPYNPNLYYHLRRANEMPPPNMEPLLAASPATRVPVLGGLWQRVRGQVHALVLFYVNRLASHDAQLNNHLISALNELTRLTQAQEAEITALRTEIQALKRDQS